MELHLNYTPSRSLLDITHEDKIMLIGSCFAENIGKKLLENKFNCLINPNGILFNPASIAAALHSYIKPDKYQLRSGENNGLHFSYDHHGSFSYSSKAELEKEIKRSIAEAHSFLKETKILIITLGSAFVYRRMEDATIVANCHKLPHNNFMKGMMYPDDIVSVQSELINELRDFNPELRIIYTISPVKYLRDGLVGNSISKSSLIQAVHRKVAATSNPKSTLLNYFPAYELVTDDLRDYRFYKEDMAHPNEQAINYVWEKFSDCYFNEETKKLNQKIKEVTLAVNHRPLKADSVKHSEFINTITKKCTDLENSYPFLNFSEEKEQLINQ